MSSERVRVCSGVDRREFLAAGAGLAIAGGIRAECPPPRPAPRRRAPARNLVLLVCDGGGLGMMSVGSQFMDLRGEGPGHWMSLWKDPRARTGLADTASADSIVTDSAASASAWGIGEMVNNGAVNITPDSRAPEPLLVRAKRAGKATGLVTTTRVTDATPACMVANVPKREMEAEIAPQIIERGVDLVLGGGSRFFPEDLLAGFSRRRTREELASPPGSGRTFGFFTQDHFPWFIDRGPGVPTLEEMTRAALAMLPARGDGFALLVEGGLPDKGAHNNDAGATIFDLLEFDRTVGLVREFVQGRDDTLMVVTSDHDCAGVGLSAYGNDGRRKLGALHNVTHSYEWIGARAAEIPDPEDRIAALPSLVQQATGATLSADESGMLARAARQQRVDPYAPANGVWMVLGSLLANHLGVAFLSPNHTSSPVGVIALGPGSENLPARGHHVDVHRMMTAALDV